eukprot:69752-Rhodomonas_salina.1
MAEIDKMKEAPDVPVMVLGNKSDLVERRRVQVRAASARLALLSASPVAVSVFRVTHALQRALLRFTNDAQRYCSEKKVPLAETSAKTAFGVENAFCSFSEKMLERRDLSGDSGQNSMSAMEVPASASAYALPRRCPLLTCVLGYCAMRGTDT